MGRYDEKLHPRGRGGKWTSKGSGGRGTSLRGKRKQADEANLTRTEPAMTTAQRNMLRVLSYYDDEIRYDTRDRNTLRTLRSLARKGLVTLDEDVMDDGRYWARLT